MHNNAQRTTRKRQTKRHVAYLRIDDAALRGLRRIAETDERPVSWVIREAIRQYVERREAKA